MREIDWTLNGPSEDWILFEGADVSQVDAATNLAQPEADDDESFERWLASLSADRFEHILSGLLDDPAGAAVSR